MTPSYQYLRSKRKGLLLLVLAVFALLISMMVDICTGPGAYSVQTVLSETFSAATDDPRRHIIIWDLRLPTSLLAVLVGAMLGLAGAGIQTILDNPLAEPFTLGISSAASFGAALAIVLGAGMFPVLGTYLVTLSAFVFSIFTALLLYLFTRLRGASSETLVLVGIALLFSFNALLGLLQFAATDVQLSQIVFWMMGSLGRADWQSVTLCAVVLLLVLPLLIGRSWALTALRMGDDKAASLGVNVRRLRIEVLAGASLLAATTVSFVGTVIFVGLVGPHIARMLVGEDQRLFLPMSALCGALLMSLTSILSKSVTEGVVYPIGIITALIGVPFFLSLVLKAQKGRWQ